MCVNEGAHRFGVVVAAPSGPGRGPGKERLDVVPFESGYRREVWVVVADELPEDGQGAGQLVDGEMCIRDSYLGAPQPDQPKAGAR